MKKGFTLIELLAVITILAIILLISIPALGNIITNSKEKAKEDSINLYGRAIENAINEYYVKYPLKTEVTIKQLEDGGFLNLKGNKVECDTVRIIDRDVYLADCKVGNKYVDATYGENLGKLVDDADKDGKISRGDKYTYKVNNEDKFNFYVLGKNPDGTINLIMDRNICEDGTTNYTEENNYCKYAWHEKEDDANYGPDTAMTIVYNATKDWIYVPDMIMNYEDNKEDEIHGYTSIITDPTTKVTTITGKQNKTSEKQTIGNIEKPLKGRMPTYEELYKDKEDEQYCTNEDATCPVWLVDNLTYQDNEIQVGDRKLKRGDVNGDGKIDQTDADLIQRYTSLNSADNIILETSDVDIDSKVTVNDALNVSRYIIGIYNDCFISNNSDKISKYSSNRDINQNIQNYMLLTDTIDSYNNEEYTYVLNFYGGIKKSFFNSEEGIRPVITVSKKDLS